MTTRCGAAIFGHDALKLAVAVIDDRTLMARRCRSSRKLPKKGIKGEQFTTDKADFMAILTAIKGKNPDAIFYGGMDPQAGPMLRQMEQYLSNVKLFGGDARAPKSCPSCRARPHRSKT
jgi:branched-chain amino acid transport system substrate-binding protein